MLKLEFYGLAAEAAGSDSKNWNIEQSMSLSELKNRLFAEVPELQSVSLQFAVNNKLGTETSKINKGDTVAVMPPFAGG